MIIINIYKPKIWRKTQREAAWCHRSMVPLGGILGLKFPSYQLQKAKI